jgi:hypothetical protein
MYFSACCGKGGGSCIRASEAQHLMTRVDEFLNDGGADEACDPADKDPHILFCLPRLEFSCCTMAIVSVARLL